MVFILALISIVFVSALLYFSSSLSGDKSIIELEKQITAESIEIIRNPDAVKVVEVSRGFIKTDLDPNLVGKLQKLILNDKNYIFDHKKQAIFFPTIGFQFKKGNQKVLIFYSKNAKKLEFTRHKNQVMLDCDPVNTSFENFIKQIQE